MKGERRRFVRERKKDRRGGRGRERTQRDKEKGRRMKHNMEHGGTDIKYRLP